MANGDSPANKGALSNLLLPAALAALAIAVAILAWIVFALLDLDSLLTKEEFRKRMDAVDAAHEEISKSVEKRVTTEHFDERIDELEELLTRCCKGGSPRLEVMFENAGLNGASSLNEDSPGIVLSNAQEIKLDKLADALIACATPPSESVSLKVQGYSSTRPFKGTSVRISNELNLSAANLRAEVVIDHLVARVERDPIGKSRVDIRYEPWLDYEDIQRPFEDKARFSGMDQEQLNRVVYIDLQDAGGCERTT